VSRVLVRNKANPNTTTRTGKVVHASSRDGYPSCGRYVYGIVYTDEPVNCEGCAK